MWERIHDPLIAKKMEKHEMSWTFHTALSPENFQMSLNHFWTLFNIFSHQKRRLQTRYYFEKRFSG